jgi:hypothetical protein
MNPTTLVSLVKEHGALGALGILCFLTIAAIKVLWAAWHRTIRELANARSELDECRKKECERLYQEVVLAQAFERQIHAQVAAARSLLAAKEPDHAESQR